MKRALVSSLFSTLAAFAALFALAPAQAQTYKLSDTGYLGSNQAIDGTGQSLSPTGIVGGYSGEAGSYQGYLWQNGTITALPDLPGSVGDTRVFGINSAGIAVGACSDYFNPFNYAVRWQNGAVTNLGSLGGGTNGGAALAINDSGTIAGFSFATDRLGSPEVAAYYDTAWHALPYLTGAPSGAYAEAHAINASGECAGWCYGTDGQYHATLWKGGKAYDLGTVGGTSSQADGMNDAGMVVGYFQTKPDANGITYDHAFLWMPTTANGTTGTIQDLGTLPGGTDSKARDINNNNQIVGYGSNGPFLWDAAHGMRSLNDLVTSAQLSPTPDAYYMTDAVAINDNGQIAGDFTEVFVGAGDINHGCFLEPNGGTTAAKAKTLAFTPNPVVGGQNVTGTVTLTAAAPAGGAVVTITENGTSLGTITVPAGATSTTFTLNTSAVTATETDTLGAVYGGATVTTTLTITPANTAAALQSVSLNPTTVVGGTANTTGTVTLTANAPAGGAVVTLSSSTSAITFSASTVTVPAGATSVTFRAYSHKVTSTVTATITAKYAGVSKTATVKVTPATTGTATLTGLSFSPTSVVGGAANTTGTVTLSAAAPAGGAVVSLKSSTSAITFSASTVTVAAGATTATFRAYSHKVTSTVTATVTVAYSGVSKTATVKVTAATPAVTLASYAFNPSTVKSGTASTATVTLTGAAPAGGAVVNITYNGAAFYSVTVAAGQTSIAYSQPTSAVTVTTSDTFTASYNGVSKTATLTITP